MTIKDVKNGLIECMQTIFPKSEYKYYSMAVVENYDRPCFFVQLKATDTSPANYNSRNMYGALYIDHFQESVDESKALDMIQKLQDGFGLAVTIGDRAVYVENMDWDFIGSERNHLQITIDLMWTVRIDHSETLPIMESAEINSKIIGGIKNGNA